MDHQSEQEKKMMYRARLYKFQKANQKTLCYFNLLSTVTQLGLAIATFSILRNYEFYCSTVNLHLTLWLVFVMHIINFVEGLCNVTGL